jgi:serine acetyltransferase
VVRNTGGAGFIGSFVVRRRISAGSPVWFLDNFSEKNHGRSRCEPECAAHLAPLGRVIAALNCAIFGIEVVLRCRIGPGIFRPQTHETFIGAAVIGRIASISQGVTPGARYGDITFPASHRPTIGHDVKLSVGAVVRGGACVWNGTVVGANAVVLADVPDGCPAVGVPARIMSRIGFGGGVS